MIIIGQNSFVKQSHLSINLKKNDDKNLTQQCCTPYK